MKHINWYGERSDGSLIYAESNHEMLCLIERGFDMKPLYELDLQEIAWLQTRESIAMPEFLEAKVRGQ